MTELFICPHCQARTFVEEQYKGRSGPCYACGRRITIPGGDDSFLGTGLFSSRPREAAQPAAVPRNAVTRNLCVGAFWGAASGLLIVVLLHAFPTLLLQVRAYWSLPGFMGAYFAAVAPLLLQLPVTGLVVGAILFVFLGLLSARHPAATQLACRRAITGAITGAILGAAAHLIRPIIQGGFVPMMWAVSTDSLAIWSALGAALGAITLGTLAATLTRWQTFRLNRLAPLPPVPLQPGRLPVSALEDATVVCEQPESPFHSEDSPPAAKAPDSVSNPPHS